MNVQLASASHGVQEKKEPLAACPASAIGASSAPTYPSSIPFPRACGRYNSSPPTSRIKERAPACVRAVAHFPFFFWPWPAARRMPLANDLLLHAEDERQMSARRTAAGKQLKWKASRMLSLTTPPPPPSLARLGRLAQRGSAVGGPQTRQLIPNDYTAALEERKSDAK